jgi:hypothetical protein
MTGSNTNALITISIDKAQFSIDDGRFVLDPGLLPAVCPTCGGEGTSKQRIRIKVPYDWRFWLPIAALLGGPILFGIGAALVYWIFGNDALANYASYGVACAVIVAALGGFRMASSNKENWFLTFYFCQQCAGVYKKLTSISRLCGWGVIVLLLGMMVIAVATSSQASTTVVIQFLVWVLLLGAILGLAGFVTYRARRASFRGFKAQWAIRRQTLKITLKNRLAAEVVRSKLPSEKIDKT